MEALQNWAMAVCTAAVAGGIASLAAPSGGTQKVFRITVSVFFLCCLLAPILHGLAPDSFSWERTLMQSEVEDQSASLEESLSRQELEQFRTQLEGLVGQAVREAGGRPEEIEIEMYIEESGGIDITEIRILLAAEDRGRREEILDRVQTQIGQKPVLEFPAGG